MNYIKDSCNERLRDFAAACWYIFCFSLKKIKTHRTRKEDTIKHIILGH